MKFNHIHLRVANNLLTPGLEDAPLSAQGIRNQRLPEERLASFVNNLLEGTVNPFRNELQSNKENIANAAVEALNRRAAFFSPELLNITLLSVTFITYHL